MAATCLPLVNAWGIEELLRCPKCESRRIRLGYSQPHLALRLLGFRELLCDSCNLVFRAFAPPGTLPPRSGRSGERRRRRAPPPSSDAPPAAAAVPAPESDHAAGSAAPRGVSGKRLLAFARYYLRLRLDVLTGRRRTDQPLDVEWRWQHWQRRRRKSVHRADHAGDAAPSSAPGGKTAGTASGGPASPRPPSARKEGRQ